MAEAFMTATQLGVVGEESLCYLTVLNVRLRMSMPGRALCARNIRFLLLTRSFKLETSEWSLEPTKPSPRPVAPSPACKESTASERHSMRD